MQLNNWKYIVGFAGVVCFVCSLFVAIAAVVLKDRQETNALLDKQKKVLALSGIVESPDSLTAEQVTAAFRDGIVTELIDLDTGEYVTDEFPNPGEFDQQDALNDSELSSEAPKNPAGIARIPNVATVYRVVNESGKTQRYVLPIEGKGLWSTLYGFIALNPDTNTVDGIIFYQHGETPGLGGEVDNPRWKDRWPGRKIYNDEWEPVIQVIKGAAPPPSEAPHKIDGLSGATITSNGVTHLVRFWLGEHGFGPYLARLRAEGSTA